MFQYFPNNYGWSLSVNMALNMGGEISEIDEICGPLRPLADADDASAMDWFTGWAAMSARLDAFARRDESENHARTASRKYLRSALYLFIAERQVVSKTNETQQAYQHAVDLFQDGARAGALSIRRVEVPYRDTSFPALLLDAQGDAGSPAPAMVHFGGLDINKELIYLWHVYDLAQRGVAVLICDHPGLGEALRFRGLHASYDIEGAGSASYDYLAAQPGVDPGRIGIIAPSLGGYYAPRIAAFEPRFACCVAWGAIWSLPELFTYLDAQERPAMSVPLDEQFRWVLGAESIPETRQLLDKWELASIMDRITCPILIAHGDHDQQAPAWAAQKTFDAATSSANRTLRLFTPDEGGAEHCHIDNITIGTDYMFDWITDVLRIKR